MCSLGERSELVVPGEETCFATFKVVRLQHPRNARMAKCGPTRSGLPRLTDALDLQTHTDSAAMMNARRSRFALSTAVEGPTF